MPSHSILGTMLSIKDVTVNKIFAFAAWSQIYFLIVVKHTQHQIYQLNHF